MVVLVFGLPGAGKTFFARRLAEKLHAVHLSSDSIRRETGAWGHYSEAAKRNTYERMLKKMQDCIRSGADVVIDATFYKKALRDKFFHASVQSRQTFKMIEMKAGEACIKQRLSKPRADSEADYNVYKKIKEAFEPAAEEHLVLFSDKETIRDMLQKATAYIRATT